MKLGNATIRLNVTLNGWSSDSQSNFLVLNAKYITKHIQRNNNTIAECQQKPYSTLSNILSFCMNDYEHHFKAKRFFFNLIGDVIH